MARKTRRHRMRSDRRPTRKITGVITTGGVATALTALASWSGVELAPELVVGIAWLLTSGVGYRLRDQPDQPE